MQFLPLITSCLAVIGLYTCWHFAEGHFNVRNARKRAEVVCSDDSCTRLADTPYAKLLIIPNWYWGTAFYLLVLATAVSSWRPLLLLACLGSVAAVGMGIILIWALTQRLRFFCVYCYTAHAVNLCLLIFLLLRLAQA
jgi:uncharacterized membrane protein